MDKHISYGNKQLIIKFTLDDKEIEVLKTIKEKGQIGYTDKDDENLGICQSLYEEGFLDLDNENWLADYILTDIGESFVNNCLR